MNVQTVKMNGTTIVQKGNEIWINGKLVVDGVVEPSAKYSTEQLVSAMGLGFVMGCMFVLVLL